MGARLVITDSGGIQEESTYLDLPCLTVRPNTERPITISEGTNKLVEPAAIVAEVGHVMAGDWPSGRRPELWDGKTAARCVNSLRRAIAARAAD
jgi:UDP-N-acetylglucosamine 2-epimerase (non-hydrolysing)